MAEENKPRKSKQGKGVARRKKEQKRAEAEARAAARAQRSPQAQIALLDKRLGKGVGAARERARLMS